MKVSDSMETTHLRLAQQVADKFNRISAVEAIALGGSGANDTMDQHSDIDVYVFTTNSIPLVDRQKIVEDLGASRADLNLTFWDTGDEWYDLNTGIEVDIIYWDKPWIESELNRVLTSHQANMGYSTCFWQTILNCDILYDRGDWLSQLQETCDQPYPENLVRNIVAKNHPVMHSVIPSYYAQIKKALDRDDRISLNHRIAALFASYFDVLFAINRVLHPGEKKMLSAAETQCTKIPAGLSDQVNRVLRSAAGGDKSILSDLDELLDGLDALLILEGFDISRTRYP